MSPAGRAEMGAAFKDAWAEDEQMREEEWSEPGSEEERMDREEWSGGAEPFGDG